MVYGRILYNNIKEYTPKWYPTIPYSQTVKPVFSIYYHLFKKEALKQYPASMLTPTPRLDGDYSPEYSNKTHGCGKSSFFLPPLPCTTPSTFPFSPPIRLTTLIEPTMPLSPKNEPTRKNSKNLKMLKHEANELKYISCNSYFIVFPSLLNRLNKWKIMNIKLRSINSLLSTAWVTYAFAFLCRRSAIFSVAWLTYSLWFDFFSIWFAKSTFPNKNIAVSSSCCKKVSLLRKRYRVDLSSVSIHRVC